MNVASFLKTRELGGASAPRLRIDLDGAGEVRVRLWIGARWERVWAHQKYRCCVGYPGCGFLRQSCFMPTTPAMGVVQIRNAPRRRCQATTASEHETALHYLVGCGDVKAVERAVQRGWAFGAAVDESVDFFAMKEEDIRQITAFTIDTEATTKDCLEDLHRDDSDVTPMDVLIAKEINWPGSDRTLEMVGALLHGRSPSAALLWKARKNPSVARELIRRGAPHTDAVVGVVPEQWRKYMGDSPFTMLAHAFYEAIWEPRRYFEEEAAEEIAGFIDALLDAGERGNNGDYDSYSWEIMFEHTRTCLKSRLRRALGWDVEPSLSTNV